MNDLATICAEFEVEFVAPHEQRQRRPGQTCAYGTLAKILEDEGEAHLRSLLITILESENNRMALMRPVILAVSDVLRAHPTWFGADWLAIFDKIDLNGLYLVAKSDREAIPPRFNIASMILTRLRQHFAPALF